MLRACVHGSCGTVNLPEGTQAATQTDGDCKKSVCDGNGSTKAIDDEADCATPTCMDKVKNAAETGVDCGGPACAACADGDACVGNSDCSSGVCAGSVCASSKPIITALSATGHDRFFGAAFDPQGNIYATGVVAPGTDAATDYSMVVAKFSPAGVLDKTFGADGLAIKNVAVGANGELARGIVVQSTGKIVIAGAVEHAGAADPRDRDIAVLRFNADGKPDTTFGQDGVAILNLSEGEVVGNGYVADGHWGLSVYPDDRLIVTGSMKRTGGTDSDFAVVRLTPDGAYDATFGSGGVASLDINNQNASPRTATILDDGSVLMTGYMSVTGTTTPVIFKLTSAGQLDTTFGTNGVFNQAVFAAATEVYGAVLQGTKLVTTGYGRANESESLDFVSLRVTSSGKLDPSYGISGATRIDIGGFNDNSRGLVVLPDQRILLIGGGRLTANNVDGIVAMLTPNGQTDQSFAPFGWKAYDFGGPSDFLWGVALAPSKTYAVAVGILGVGANPGNDDTALVLIPTSK